MSERILITGANGQLGNCLRDSLKAYTDLTVYYTDVDSLDITSQEAVNMWLQQQPVDYIINCAAYTAVDKAEEDIKICRLINTKAVGIIGKAATEIQAKVIHISTDYVFDGTNHRPYTEEDATHPVSVYGQTKRDGEVALLHAQPDSMVIRTSWLYSAYGNNFVKTMIRLGEEREEIRVVADQIGTPTYAADLAGIIVEIIIKKLFMPGIYHFSNEGVCSWYDFAREIFKQSGLSTKVTPIETTDYPTRAQRPYYSVLNKKKIKTNIKTAIPHWTESLAACLGKLNR